MTKTSKTTEHDVQINAVITYYILGTS